MIRSFLSAAALAASAAAQAAPLACQPQSQIDAGAIRGQLILLGELHGTNEMPLFMSGLACSLLQAGRAVVLSLEVPSDVHPEIERYMVSDGGVAARQPLYASAFGRLDDGRGSTAYMAVIEQVRSLRRAGAPISLAATDMRRDQDMAKAGAKWDPNARDRIMADNIAALARAHPDAAVISLSGNLHASQKKGGMLGADYEPLGYVLARRMHAYSIAFAHDGGSAWVCLGDANGKPQCGTHGMGAQNGESVPGYDRVVKLGAITASPPVQESRSALGSQGGAQ